jgi:ribosomal protein S18 acetylase RimI-like enzyme
MERRYDELRQELAPKPHLYLALLAIDPACQGQGFASALVRPMLQRLDETGLPAYVETQNLKNVAMYRRFGFNLLQEDAMPGAGLTMYLMARRCLLKKWLYVSSNVLTLPCSGNMLAPTKVLIAMISTPWC